MTIDEVNAELERRHREKLEKDSTETVALLRGSNALLREHVGQISLLDAKTDNAVSSARRAEVAADASRAAVQRLEIQVQGCRADVTQLNATFERLENKVDQILTFLANHERFALKPVPIAGTTDAAATGAGGAE